MAKGQDGRPAAGAGFTLSGISELVFLDRYAMKDPHKENLAPGDVVVVLTKDDPKWPQKEAGRVVSVDGDEVTVELKATGERIVRPRKHVERVLEPTPAIMWDRMAEAIVTVEKPERRKELVREFRWLLDGFRFVPGGRINTMLGTGQQLTAFNCYVIPMRSNDGRAGADSRAAIMDTLANMVEIMSRGGGVGINLSTLRPRLSYVKGVNGRSSGAVSWGGLYSFATGLVEQGGSRRGALMLILNDWHPDVIDFINAKKDMRAITNANISVGISDAFMKAVEEDGDWDLVFPDTSDPDYDTLWDGNLRRWRDELKKPVLKHRTVKARAMWDNIMESAWASAEPGVVFLDRANANSNSWYFHELNCTNPCVTGDTLISTDEGLRRAEELYLRGEPVRVVADSRVGAAPDYQGSQVFLTGIKQVYRLVTEEGYEVRLTADHKVRTERGWVSAKDLVKGDKILVLNRPGGFGTEGSYELGLALGWLVGDGTLKADRAVLSFFGEEKREMAPVLAAAVNRAIRTSVKNRRYVVGVVDIEQRDEARVQSARLREIAETHGLLEHKFQVPEVVYRGTREMQVGFLRGLFSADGHVENSSRRGVILTSKALGLLKEVQRLLLNHGIYSRINLYRRRAGSQLLPDGRGGAQYYRTKAIHEITITGTSLVRFAEHIGFLQSAKTEKLRRLLASYTPRQSAFRATFRELVPAGEELVYDLQVPGINAFGANGLVVHNCGEQFLPGWGVCNLGHLNLARFVKDGQILWDDLSRAARLGVRFLDNIIDYTPYFFEENKRTQLSERRVGMGTLGLAEMLIRLGVRYGSPESLQLIDKVYGFIAEQAYLASAELAAEKGAFPKFDAEKFLQSGFMRGMPEHVREAIRQKGCRNVTLLTQAPTGSTGTMAGTSTGIEPYYSWTYWRTSRLGTKEVRERIVEEWFAAHPEVEPDLANLPDYFVTALDLSPEEHVRVQAAVQRWTDSSISKTANAPASYTVEQTRQLYEYAYRLGCKGVTIYRDKSRDMQVLSQKDDPDALARAGADKPEAVTVPPAVKAATAGHPATAGAAAGADVARQAEPAGVQAGAPAGVPGGGLPKTQEGRLQALRWPRPEVLEGKTRRVNTPAGTLWLTMNTYDGQPFEVFATIGKAGSDVLAMAEAIARLISLNLRCGVPLVEVVEQLRGIGGSRSVGFGPHRVLSIPDAIGRALAEEWLGESNGGNGGGHAGGQPEETQAPAAVPHGACPRVQGGSGSSAPSFDMCPHCGNAALIHQDGCVICASCGHSEC